MNMNIATHKDTGSPPRSGEDRDEVARRAYQLWEAGGRPAGRDLEFWLQAEAELHFARRSRSPKTGVSRDGPAHESPEASAPSPQPDRTEQSERRKRHAMLAVSSEGPHGPKLAGSKSRPGGSAALRRFATEP